MGLKDYISNVKDVTKAEAPKAFSHYSRATLKAIPLCVFNSDAKVTIEVKDGDITVKAKNVKVQCESLKVMDDKGTATALEVTP